MTISERQAYAIGHPVRSQRDFRDAHAARSRRRFQTVLVVELGHERPRWRVTVAFLNHYWHPMPIHLWQVGALDVARGLARELLVGVGEGANQEEQVKNTLLSVSREVSLAEMAVLNALAEKTG